MPAIACVQCGQALAEGARFCGHCGATQAVTSGAKTLLEAPKAAQAPAAAPAPVSSLAGGAAPAAVNKQTMVGFASPFAPPAQGAPAPAGPAKHLAAAKTMLGIPGSPGMPDLPPVAPAAAPAAARAPAPAPAPGLAATPAPVPTPTPAAAAPVPPKREMHMTMPLQVAYVPPPAPLPDLPAPPPPVIVRKRGIPLSVVAILIAVILMLGAAVIALLWKSTPPISAKATSTADGRDTLHLECEARSCPDGTSVSLDGAKTIFAAGQADLTLAMPLHIGDNNLTLEVARPSGGRDQAVKLVVHVAYRVRADVTTMSAPHPAITVRIEAKPGTVVSIDGKPVTLDATGLGAYTIDESATTEGPADESRVVSLDSTYELTPPGAAAEKGTVSARVAVSPLRVDAPCPRSTTDEDHALFSGRAPKGASVSVDGAPVTVGADGSFETTVPLPATGDHTVEVRASTQALVQRTVHVTATRVASMADAAKSFEQQQPIGYDAAMADLAGKTGAPIVVDGAVVEARASGHRTLMLVDDKRGCAKGPCLARVVVGRDITLARGAKVRAYGYVARPFTTPAGQTVPEIESAFVLQGKR
jgi:hypothetical protein